SGAPRCPLRLFGVSYCDVWQRPVNKALRHRTRCGMRGEGRESVCLMDGKSGLAGAPILPVWEWAKFPPGDAPAMAEVKQARFAGRSLPRREDRRLLTGRGQLIADFDLPHMLHAVFVRSPLAHARIRAVDLSRAAAAPGVVYVLSGAELAKLLPPVPDTQLSL